MSAFWITAGTQFSLPMNVDRNDRRNRYILDTSWFPWIQRFRFLFLSAPRALLALIQLITNAFTSWDVNAKSRIQKEQIFFQIISVKSSVSPYGVRRVNEMMISTAIFDWSWSPSLGSLVCVCWAYDRKIPDSMNHFSTHRRPSWARPGEGWRVYLSVAPLTS